MLHPAYISAPVTRSDSHSPLIDGHHPRYRSGRLSYLAG
jgi:hypothetical protein